MHLMDTLKLQETRATSGTRLTEVALRVAGPKATVTFAKDAM